MTYEDRELDTYLRTLHVPPAPWLAERILAAAAWERPRSSWAEMLSALLLPRPAFALALIMLLGVMAGWQAPLGEEAGLEYATQDGVEFLYAEGDVL